MFQGVEIRALIELPQAYLGSLREAESLWYAMPPAAERGNLGAAIPAASCHETMSMLPACLTPAKPGLLTLAAMLMLSLGVGGPCAHAQGIPPAAAADPLVDPLIAEVQRLLAEQGYAPGPASGVASAQSRDAVRAYQRDGGIAETGLFTQALLERLRAAPPRSASPSPPLKFSNEVAPLAVEAPPAPPVPRPKPLPPAKPEKAPPPANPPPPARTEAAAEQKARERGAQEGTLEIFLAWSSTSDIDLHVRCPTGQNIWFRNMEDCGGKLDLDTNALGTPTVSDPVEHIVFPAPMEGSYRIEIANCELMGPPEAFRLWVVYRGKTIAQSRNDIPIDPGWSWPCGEAQSYLSFRIPQ